MKKFSEVKFLMIFIPPIVSSISDNKCPSKEKISPDWLLMDLLIFEIKYPEIGRKKQTKKVNFQLIKNIEARVKTIVKGSLTIIKTLIKAVFIVLISEVMRDIKSPFLSLEKKETGKLIIF